MNCDQGMSSCSERQKAAAGEPHRVRDDRQQRQGDDERDDSRHDQQLDRIHTHRAQRVGLLVELHHADFRGKRAPRAAGDDDGRQQNAHLAQHRDRTRSTTNMSAPKLRELLRSEIGDDHADQKGDQRDDRDRR